MDVKKLSASAIKTYEQCPMRFYATYVLKVPEPPPHPLTAMGSAIHRMFENATFARTAGRMGGFDPETYKEAAMKEFNVDPTLSSLIDELVANAVRWGYFRKINKTIGCEVKFTFTLDDGTPINGIIDRLDIEPPTADIIDLKTQKNAFETDELDYNWQARIYNVAVRKDHPEVTGPITVSFWVLRHRVQRIICTAEDAERTLVDLTNMLRMIRADNNPKGCVSGLCRYCAYCDQCPTQNQSVRTRSKR